MDRPPRLVIVLEYDLDPATWRPYMAEDVETQIRAIARGMGYEPVLDGDDASAPEVK